MTTAKQRARGRPLDVLESLSEEPLDTDTAGRVAAVFWGLADPTRIRIIHALTLRELHNSELAALLELSESAVSHQMRELRLLNIVRARRHGRTVTYSLNDGHVRHVFEDMLRHVAEDATASGAGP